MPKGKPSRFELFWTHSRYAVVGKDAERSFPKLSYRALKELGKTVYPVLEKGGSVEGDTAFACLADLPEPVDAVVIEVPKEETEGFVRQAVGLGVPRIWIHDGRHTKEALALAEANGLEVLHGTCAVQYLTKGFSIHAIHRFFRKLSGNY